MQKAKKSVGLKQKAHRGLLTVFDFWGVNFQLIGSNGCYLWQMPSSNNLRNLNMTVDERMHIMS